MVIYTKTGDDGTTAIFTKKSGKSVRLSKSDVLIEAIGSVDEVNSYIGIIDSKLKTQKSKVKTKAQSSKLRKKLQEIQRDLFTIGAGLAGAELRIQESRIKNLEFSIDKMEKELPKITDFILPGGTEIASHLMYARVLVRKAEREIVYSSKLKVQNSKLQLKTQNLILKYMNRLSDYLFVLARWMNFRNKVREIGWKD